MNRKISMGWGIVIVLVLAVVVAGVVLCVSKREYKIEMNKVSRQKSSQPAQKANGSVADKQKACQSSGGKVSSASCCGQTQDFPNNCAIGACGCAPSSSHQIKTCECGAGKCFDGNACVTVGSQANNIPANWKTFKNSAFGIQFSYPPTWKIDQSRSTSDETVFDVGTGSESHESIVFEKNSKNLTLAQVKDEIIPADPASFVKQANLVIASEKAIEADSSEFSQTFYVFLHGGNAFMITTQGAFTKQIIGTIKFVD